MADWEGDSGGERDERYLKLNNGATRLRMVDDGPIFKFTHWIGNKPYNCPGPQGGCPACKANADAKAQFQGDAKDFKAPYRNQRAGLVNVLVYSPEPAVKIYSFGTTISKALQALDKNEDWGDLRDYDVEITRSGTGLGTTYSVTPKPKKPLSAELQGLVDNGRHDLEKEAIPATISVIATAMGGGPAPVANAAELPSTGANDKASKIQVKLLEAAIKRQGANLTFEDFGIDPENLTNGEVQSFMQQLGATSATA